MYIAYLLIAIGAGISISNWSIPYKYIKKEKVPSTAWFVGGIMLAVGFIGIKSDFSSYWWVAFLIDFGSIPAVIFFASLVIASKVNKGWRGN